MLMKNKEILEKTSVLQNGNTYFKECLKNLGWETSLAVLVNEKKLKEAEVVIREELVRMETQEIKDLKDKKSDQLGAAYRDWFLSEEVQLFLHKQLDIDFKYIMLTRDKLDEINPNIEAIECLMLFTNIEDLI
jgi:hypothetical protein